LGFSLPYEKNTKLKYENRELMRVFAPKRDKVAGG
jgi:hypothetical protein